MKHKLLKLKGVNEKTFVNGSPVEMTLKEIGELPFITTDNKFSNEGYVFGEVDTGDSNAKAQLASTLARVQNDGGRKGVTVEKDSPTLSILAKYDELEKKDAVTPDDMRTPNNKEVPNALQAPEGQEVTVGEQVDIVDVWDYNDDVNYLQKYGRA